jgi:Calx-beta domain-containing protein
MRKNLLMAILAVMLSLGFFTLTQTIAGRASASNRKSPLAGAVLINDVTLAEGNVGAGNMVFTVTVIGTHTNTIGVDYSTANGSATSPSDYTSTSGQLVFPATTDEETTRTISVPIIGDFELESNETFLINLQIVDFSADLEDGQGVGTITNDDGAPTPTTTPTPTPANCTFTISPSSRSFDADGSGGSSFTVITQAGCRWFPAAPEVNWMEPGSCSSFSLFDWDLRRHRYR